MSRSRQVPEPEHPRRQRRRHDLKRGFVDLEDAEIGVSAREQGRRDAGREVAPAVFRPTRRSGSSIAASIFAVVVLPFVAEPQRFRRRSGATSLGMASESSAGAACPAGSCHRPPPHAVTVRRPPVLRRPWRQSRSSDRILSAALPPFEFDGAAGHGFELASGTYAIRSTRPTAGSVHDARRCTARSRESTASSWSSFRPGCASGTPTSTSSTSSERRQSRYGRSPTMREFEADPERPCTRRR